MKPFRESTVGTFPGTDPVHAQARMVAELLDTTRLLWREPANVTLVGRAASVPPGHVLLRDLHVMPNARQPRLLAPAGAPHAAAAALRSYAHGAGLMHRIGRSVAAITLAVPHAERLLPDRVRVTVPVDDRLAVESLEDHLSKVIGAPALIGVRVGVPRANRKPVLPVMDRRGRLLAYVKVGHNQLTRQLVEQEGEALRAVASVAPAGIQTPRVLHRGAWQDLELLILSPLRVTNRGFRTSDALPGDAMRSLSEAFGVVRQPLGDSPFWDKLTAAAKAVEEDSTAHCLQAALDAVHARYAHTPVRFGSWHGDWAPWNMARQRKSVLLWDWERFANGVPLGFDALHYRMQSAMASSGPNAVRNTLPRDAGRALDLVGVRGRTQLTVALYLTEICLRYVLDAQGPTGEPLKALAQLTTDTLADYVEQL